MGDSLRVSGSQSYTVPSGGTASEVYNHFSDVTILTNLMFHESMHNKLHLGNDGLHGLGGLAAATVDDTTQLTPSNIQKMAAALEVSRPQWTAGIPLVLSAAAVPDSDPAKGLF